MPKADQAKKCCGLGEVTWLPMVIAGKLQHEQYDRIQPRRSGADRDKRVHIRSAAFERRPGGQEEARPDDRDHGRRQYAQYPVQPRPIETKRSGRPVQNAHRKPNAQSNDRTPPPLSLVRNRSALHLLVHISCRFGSVVDHVGWISRGGHDSGSFSCVN